MPQKIEIRVIVLIVATLGPVINSCRDHCTSAENIITGGFDFGGGIISQSQLALIQNVVGQKFDLGGHRNDAVEGRRIII